MLARLISVAGVSQVVLGTDHPFDMGDDAPLELLDAIGLSTEDWTAVAGGNLAELARWGPLGLFDATQQWEGTRWASGIAAADQPSVWK